MKQLAPEEIHIFKLFLPEVLVGEKVLSSEEKRRAASMQSERAASFLKTRSFVRNVLSFYLGRSPESLQFLEGPLGKPALVDSEGLEFNLSHSKDYAILAVARNKRVGIDIEFVRPIEKMKTIAEQMFSAETQKAWKATGEDAEFFFKAWVFHEAYFKALGQSIVRARNPVHNQIDLTDVRASEISVNKFIMSDIRDAVRLPALYAAAVAVEGGADIRCGDFL